MNIKVMTYKELETKLTENRRALYETKDSETQQRLVKQNRDLMLEMDRRWNEAERLQRENGP